MGSEVEVADDFEVVDAALATNLLDSRALPDMAAWLVALGRDSESLVALAGLDLGPFDPRSARELWAAARAELGCSKISWLDSLLLAASLVATAWARGELDDRGAWRLMVRLGVEGTTTWHEEQQSELDDVLLFFWHDDEWGAGYGSFDAERRRIGEAALTRLADRSSRLSDEVVTAAVRMMRR